MSATISHPSIAQAALPTVRAWPLQFGAESGVGERTVQWLLRRNCSITPRQMVLVCLSLCAVSLGIAAMFWLQGATLVMPFATVEVLALCAALLIYSRHATDFEAICLAAGRLTVEYTSGRTTRRVEFAPSWVRVEPEHSDGSLVELSGQGQRISVGRFVRPELRRQLADELRWALRRWQTAAQRDNALQDKSEN
ncbi:MAG: DUF2244 domain-containing protein [Burkholderiales bacterium]